MMDKIEIKLNKEMRTAVYLELKQIQQIAAETSHKIPIHWETKQGKK